MAVVMKSIPLGVVDRAVDGPEDVLRLPKLAPDFKIEKAGHFY